MTKCDIILNRVSMSELLNKYGFRFFQNKRQYVCPFHKDSNPSAVISKDGKWFHCFGCGINYNVIDFVANHDKCSRKMAIAKLNVMFDLCLDELMDKEQIREIQEKQRQVARELQRQNKIDKMKTNALRIISEKLDQWDNVRKSCHLTKGQYRSGDWEFADLFFHSIKKIQELNDLYDEVAYADANGNIASKVINGDMIL